MATLEDADIVRAPIETVVVENDIVGGVEEDENEEEEEELLFSSDSEIGDALDFLDAKYDSEPHESFSLSSHRPNAHGGLLSRPLQPLSNRTQKYSNRIRAAPLEVLSATHFDKSMLIFSKIFWGFLFLKFGMCFRSGRGGLMLECQIQ